MKTNKKNIIEYEIELPSNRKFGLFFTIVFLVACLYSYYYGKQIWVYMFGFICIGFLLITILKEDLLLSLNKIWMKIGIFLGNIINPIVMAIIFYGIFTPLAIFMHLFGRDELNLKLKKKNSYWIDRNLETKDDTFNNQF